MADEQQVWEPLVWEYFQGRVPFNNPEHPGLNINIGRETDNLQGSSVRAQGPQTVTKGIDPFIP